MIRFFCVVGPKGRTAPWWPDISYEYLWAFKKANLPIRALPIGGTFLGQTRDMCPSCGLSALEAGQCVRCCADVEIWSHWGGLAPLFSTPMEDEFINVVCAPVGLSLGTEQTIRQFHAEAKSDTVVYTPETALSGLYTADHVNIAITDDGEGEEDILSKYVLVTRPNRGLVWSPPQLAQLLTVVLRCWKK